MTITFEIDEAKEIIRQHLLKMFPEGMEFEIFIFMNDEKDIVIEATQQK